MLQLIFGDDEHTASEGPYSRVMKTRKWLYMGSIALIAIGSGLYNENAATEALKFINIPTTMLKTGLIIGLTYLLIQYALLVFQLITTYDITLSERFTSRRSEELQAARERLRAAQKLRDEVLDKFDGKPEGSLSERDHREIHDVERAAHENDADLARLYRQQPANRYGYTIAEVLIDSFRIPSACCCWPRILSSIPAKQCLLARWVWE